MSSAPQAAPPPSVLQKLPPERRCRKGGPVVLYSCCCCCCCCLHTVGGVIGATLVGSSPPVEDEPGSPVAEGLPSSQRLFWTSVGIPVLFTAGLLFFVGIIQAIADNASPGQPGPLQPVVSLVAFGFGLLIFGPLVLLAGCLVMALRLALSPTMRPVARYWKDLRRIAVYTVAGSLAGIGVMVLMIPLLS